MKISTFFKPLSFLPALALMYMIYSFSGETGETSSMTSYRVSRAVVETVNTVTAQHWEEWQIDSYAQQLNGIVRKGAHVTEYFLLAIAVSVPLYVYGVRGILLMLLAGIICVGFAFGDEYHQSMVAGRAASRRDVAIDSIGVFFGVILTRLIGWSGRMAITGPAYERKQNQRQRELDEREEELQRREEALRRRELRSRDVRAGRDVRAVRRPVRDLSGEGAENGRGSDRAQTYSNPDRVQMYSGPDRAQTYSGADRAQTYSDPDRTRVIGTRHEVDDRTRVYRTAGQQRELEESMKRKRFERRSVQSPDLADDNTSDQLSDDIPLSGLFRRGRSGADAAAQDSCENE